MKKKKLCPCKSRDKSPPIPKYCNEGSSVSNEGLLLKRILSAEFALWELGLYLESYPDDKTAFELHKRYSKKSRELINEFKKLYL